MAEYCRKCGSRLDPSTGRCPNCDGRGKKKKKLSAVPVAHKKRNRLKKFLFIFLFLALLGVGLTGNLIHFGIIDPRNPYSEEIKKASPETDTTGLKYYASSAENVTEDQGVTYINNEILVYLKSEKDKPKLQEYLSSIGGKIAGEITELSEYQVLLEQTYSYRELTKLIQEMEKLDWVLHSSPNYVVRTNTSYIPNDRQWENQWGDIPDGGNWGMEAIDAPGAWDYKEKLHTVNIGILDDMFLENEDVYFAEKPLGNEIAKKSVSDEKKSSHGTHVAGTAAAGFDNGKGVAGVSVKTNLYGVSSNGLSISGYYEDYDSLQAWNIAFSYLIVNKNCSVVNISMGHNELSFNASRKNKYALQELKRYSEEISEFLGLLIEHNYQFVICAAAGNQNVPGAEKYYLKENYNDEEEYAYYSEDDHESYLEGSKPEGWTEEELNKRNKFFKSYTEKELKTPVKKGGRMDSARVDAKYEVLGSITDKKVKERILMVGAIENRTHKEGGFLGIFGADTVHDGYQVASFSNRGKRVDVVAPGVGIESTVENGYDSWKGTSMASPHVAGVAGLVFSANPNLKGEEVKKIIRETAEGAYGSEGYGLVNAKNAVEAALASLSEDSENTERNSNKEMKIPPEAVKFQGHYYYIYKVDTVTTWEEARAYCEMRGGYLASITSEEEDTFLYSYLQSSFDYGSAYFGFTDKDSKGRWEWSNGARSSYTNWHEGEPSSGNEDYGMYYDDFQDGTWNNGNFGYDSAFICEWGEEETDLQNRPQKPLKEDENEREIVLVLDISGSMEGTPLNETKKAAVNFVETILKEDAGIGIVTYEEEAQCISDFSKDESHLTDIIAGISAGGSTNIEAGLQEAENMLEKSRAEKKMIVLMSDGAPNEGREGEELIAFGNEIKDRGTRIYTLGFFESMYEDKPEAQYLMERLASDGCHYEVTNAEDLVFFFGDMADQINGQKYIYIRIACPVDVSVAYNGETLSSSDGEQNLRTDFGTLTFEESREDSDMEEADQIKILRLKEGADYDVKITGTGQGIMNYTIGFMDENGEYDDFRRFENIKINRRTAIDTVAAVSEESVLNIDNDGDGRYDMRLRAEENGYGEEINMYLRLYAAIGAGVSLILILLILKVRKRRKRKGKI